MFEGESLDLLAGIVSMSDVCVRVRCMLGFSAGTMRLALCCVVGQATFVRVAEEMSKHRPARLKMPLPCVGAHMEFSAYVFAEPRPTNQRVFWQYHDVYRFAKLSSYKGQPSNWVFCSYDAWRSFFEATTGHNQICLSMQTSDASGKKLAMPANERCLPNPAVSTFGLFLQLYRWSMCSPAAGGLNMETSREACGQVCMAFMKQIGAFGVVPVRVTLLVLDCFISPWPRPLETCNGRSAISLLIQDGCVDINAIHTAAVAQGSLPLTLAWSELLKSNFGCATTIDLHAFLSVCALTPKLRAVHHQVVWAASVALELALSKLGQGQASSSEVEWAWSDRAIAKGGYDMEHKLAAYVYNCQIYTRAHHVIGISTDEGTIKGLPMQVSILGLVNNVAMVCPPQACLVGSF